MNALRLVRELAVIADIQNFTMADQTKLVRAVERMKSEAMQYRSLRSAIDNIGPSGQQWRRKVAR